MLIMQDTMSFKSSEIKEKVLAQYNIDSSDYKKTIDYYNNEPERWKDFFTKAEAYIDSLKQIYSIKKP